MANDGTDKQGKIKIPYGKDNSEYSGPAAKERISDTMGGGVDNLAHSLNPSAGKPRSSGPEF